jgi:hypothetical protein
MMFYFECILKSLPCGMRSKKGKTKTYFPPLFAELLDSSLNVFAYSERETPSNKFTKNTKNFFNTKLICLEVLTF